VDIFVNRDPIREKIKFLNSVSELPMEDLYAKGLLDHYFHRPSKLGMRVWYDYLLCNSGCSYSRELEFLLQ